MQLTLKQLILNEIDNQPRGYSEQLATITNYSSGSNLKKVLRSEEKEFDKFLSIQDLVRYLFPDDEKKLMVQYSKEIDPNKKTARAMLEYLSVNRLLDDMKDLIERMSLCKNNESREFAKVYSIHHEYQTGYYNLDDVKFINNINGIKTNVIELRVKLNLMKFYGFYRQENYRNAYDISKYIDHEIEFIDDEYLKSIYKTRYNEVMSYIYLRVRDDVEEARKRAEQIINENNVIGAVAYAYYTLGCSYIFTSYDESLGNFNKCIELYEAANRDKAVINDVKSKVDLLHVLWDKEDDLYSLYPKLIKNAKKGILTESDLEKSRDLIDKDFYFLIKGIKENNTDLLLQSLILFIKKGDVFIGNIPKIELLKRNYNEDTINLLISLNS